MFLSLVWGWWLDLWLDLCYKNLGFQWIYVKNYLLSTVYYFLSWHMIFITHMWKVLKNHEILEVKEIIFFDCWYVEVFRFCLPSSKTIKQGNDTMRHRIDITIGQVKDEFIAIANNLNQSTVVADCGRFRLSLRRQSYKVSWQPSKIWFPVPPLYNMSTHIYENI